MNRKTLTIGAILTLFALTPLAKSLTTSIAEGEITDIAVKQILTGFGMVTGTINFKLGNFSWQPEEIWLLPTDTSPDDFKSNVSMGETLEIPENTTWSTCRTAVYHNRTVGDGFKIYNTGTSTQIQPDGKFCGLAYNGTYYILAKY
jgi:hypothetical protein